MAGGSLRKKPNKRSSPKPQASMASASSSSPSNFRKRFLFFTVFLGVSVVGLVGISSSMWTGLGFEEHSDQICSANVVNEFPHDPGAFTQGLLYGGNDTLFESTGLYGQAQFGELSEHDSSIGRFRLVTGWTARILVRV
ncbi:hypothetical protein Acr_03g0000890 [Actinidia rufa]|uniref:Uncharacterized protein n=1 Tax=Actinidia rufa TaxID=165716 RepID=A0A7J0EA99_9ERIC|nr:hypothetical protein Acr_03g0000890 [Actinidia rufa]